MQTKLYDSIMSLPLRILFIEPTFRHLIYRLTTYCPLEGHIEIQVRPREIFLLQSCAVPKILPCPGSQAASRDDLMATAFIPKDYSRNLDLVFDCPVSLANLYHFFILFP